MRCGETTEKRRGDDITRPDLFPLSRVLSRGERGAKKDRGKRERGSGGNMGKSRRLRDQDGAILSWPGLLVATLTLRFVKLDFSGLPLLMMISFHLATW